MTEIQSDAALDSKFQCRASIHALNMSEMTKITQSFVFICVLASFDCASAASDFFHIITKDRVAENVIYSPVSIVSGLTLTFMGAGGTTADEIRKTLVLGSKDKNTVARNYRDFLNTELRHASSGPPQLQIVNKYYVNNKLTIAPGFNAIARDYFGAEAEVLDFGDATTAVETINAWFAQNTNGKIRNVLPLGSIDGATSVVLANAIHFYGEWKAPFIAEYTSVVDFHVSTSKTVQVAMMQRTYMYKYADLTEFNAEAVELDFKNSDISMLIILPKNMDGLKDLEAKLDSKHFSLIAHRTTLTSVSLQMPKFKMEFEIDLKEPLEEFGIREVFSDAANLNGLLAVSSALPQKISQVRHKATLDINEAGCEAAAASAVVIEGRSGFARVRSFTVDHPFIFAIHNERTTFFAGHVVTV